MFNFLGGLFGYLLLFCFNLVKNYGFAIILFTLIIKIGLFPLSIKRQKGMAKQLRFSKKQRELQQKHGKDKEKYNSELQKLMEKEGSNPLSGCLPTILPALLLILIYQTVINPLTNTFHIAADKVNQAVDVLNTLPGFEFTQPNLAQNGIIKALPMFKDSFNMFTPGEIDLISNFNQGFKFLGLDLLETPKGSSFSSMLWLIPVLTVVSSFLFSFVMRKMQPNQQMQQGKGCMTAGMFIGPLFGVFFTYGAPAALGFYYIISSFFGAIESFLLMKFYSSEKIIAHDEAARVALLFEKESKIKRD